MSYLYRLPWLRMCHFYIGSTLFRSIMTTEAIFKKKKWPQESHSFIRDVVGVLMIKETICSFESSINTMLQLHGNKQKKSIEQQGLTDRRVISIYCCQTWSREGTLDLVPSWHWISRVGLKCRRATTHNTNGHLLGPMVSVVRCGESLCPWHFCKVHQTSVGQVNKGGGKIDPKGMPRPAKGRVGWPRHHLSPLMLSCHYGDALNELMRTRTNYIKCLECSALPWVTVM